MDISYSENDDFVSINEALYTPYGYLDVLDTASFLGITPSDVLSKLSVLNIIYLLTSHYTKFAVVRINKNAINDNVVRIRPTFNDRKECPFQQILLSSELIELLKTV